MNILLGKPYDIKQLAVLFIECHTFIKMLVLKSDSNKKSEMNKIIFKHQYFIRKDSLYKTVFIECLTFLISCFFATFLGFEKRGISSLMEIQ